MPISAYLPSAQQKQNTPISTRGPSLFEARNAVHTLFLPNPSKRSNYSELYFQLFQRHRAGDRRLQSATAMPCAAQAPLP
jgi:hypothetical protein